MISLGHCHLHGLPRELWGGLAVCPACEHNSRLLDLERSPRLRGFVDFGWVPADGAQFARGLIRRIRS